MLNISLFRNKIFRFAIIMVLFISSDINAISSTPMGFPLFDATLTSTENNTKSEFKIKVLSLGLANTSLFIAQAQNYQTVKNTKYLLAYKNGKAWLTVTKNGNTVELPPKMVELCNKANKQNDIPESIKFSTGTAQGNENSYTNSHFTQVSYNRLDDVYDFSLQNIQDPSLLVNETPKKDSSYVVLLANDKKITESICFQYTNEYFNGEYDLVNDPALKDFSYRQIALALMGTIFADDPVIFNAYKNYVETTFGSLGVLPWANIWAAISSDSIKTKSLEAKRKLIFLLRNDLLAGVGTISIKSGTETLNIPALLNLDNPSAFNQIYGNNRNIYLTAYLGFMYKQGKPLLSASIADELKTKKNEDYDWQNYQLLNNSQGKELAKNVLRYFSWGVEYSIPVQNKDDALDSKPDVQSTLIYKNNQKLIDDWISGIGSKTGSRENNYIKAGFVSVTRESIASATPKILDLSTIISGIKTDIQVPFPNRHMGWPLPYAPSGIDSPRTFAYKMVEQLKARNLVYATMKNPRYSFNSTAAFRFSELDNKYMTENYDYFNNNLIQSLLNIQDYKTNYVSKQAFSKAAEFTPQNGAYSDVAHPLNFYKPFIPWRISKTAIPLEELAGVDAFGMLTGAIAMSSFYNAMPALNGEKPALNLDTYFSFAVPEANNIPAGLDSTGKPIFIKSSSLKGIADGQYRFQIPDLERVSVLVPDVSLIQEGDIFYVVENKAQLMPGGWASKDKILTINDLRDKLAVLEEWKPLTGIPTVRTYRVKQPLKVREGIIGPQSDQVLGLDLTGGGHQYEILDNIWKDWEQYLDKIEETELLP